MSRGAEPLERHQNFMSCFGFRDAPYVSEVLQRTGNIARLCSLDQAMAMGACLSKALRRVSQGEERERS